MTTTKPLEEGSIVHVTNEQAYLSALEEAGNKLIVVDIFAQWCPPCRQIAPVFEALARQHPEVVFVKVDIDSFPGIKGYLSVWAMPTFYFLRRSSSCKKDCCQQPDNDTNDGGGLSGGKGGTVQVVGSFMGANERQLRRGIENGGKVGVCSSIGCTVQ